MANFKKTMMAAAGAGGAGLNVEDVFSTYLYTGNDTSQTITNGIDLAGEGGMTWLKTRDDTHSHYLFDTERGAGYYLNSDTAGAQAYHATAWVTGFNSDGFDIGYSAAINDDANDHASWTFRKAPKFFDIVTYTGNGVAGRTVSHNLGSVPGMIIVKNISLSGYYWQVYHTSTGNTDYLNLNDADATASNIIAWNNTSPTSTHFTLGNWAQTNDAAGSTYVAYLFAHNDGDGGFGPDGNQDIIKCGSFADTGSGTFSVDLGWEPQFVILKASNASDNWYMLDSMRNMTHSGSAFHNDSHLVANSNVAEATVADIIDPTPTGFISKGALGAVNIIYMAIRRGPMAVPESATEVFETKTYSGTGAAQVLTTSLNAPDMAITQNRSNSGALNPGAYDRLRGDEYLQTSNTSAAISSSSYGISVLSDKQNTVDAGNFASTSGQTYVGQIFKRAPGFFDVVAYTGNNTTQTVSHNLGVAPELVIVKSRSATGFWRTLSTSLSKYANLNTTGAFANAFIETLFGNNTAYVAPTETQFTLGSDDGVNNGSVTYVAYLFATLPGISKVGSYTGNGGASQDIDCGFTSGARFVLVKAASGTGDWWIWDTERGITAGNDSSMRLNTTDAAVTTLDFIDPLSSGFTVVGSDSSRNGSGIEYIFYAIA